MQRSTLHSRIHRATITRGHLHDVGSVTMGNGLGDMLGSHGPRPSAVTHDGHPDDGPAGA